MSDKLYLDLETFSRVDLETFSRVDESAPPEILFVCWAADDGTVHTWAPAQLALPLELIP